MRLNARNSRIARTPPLTLVVLVSLVAGIPNFADCSGGDDDGTTGSLDRGVAAELETAVGRPIQDVSCHRITRGGYRCTFTGEHGCEVVDPIVRGARVTGVDQGALADAAVCKAGRLAPTPAVARSAEIAENLRVAIEAGRWSPIFKPGMRRVSCMRERPPFVTAQYRCAARAIPAGPRHIAFVQSEGARIVAVWPVP